MNYINNECLKRKPLKKTVHKKLDWMQTNFKLESEHGQVLIMVKICLKLLVLNIFLEYLKHPLAKLIHHRNNKMRP